MYSRSGVGYILVITDSVYKAETDRKGIDGQPIIIDIAFNPMRYALNFATAYQLPIELGNTIFLQAPSGPPGYGPINMPRGYDGSPSTDIYAIGGVYKYKYVSDIQADVQIGDKIYFKPRTLNNKANFMGMLKDDKGKPSKYIYKVPYENIFCTVRDNQITMIGGWVLLDPIYEDWEDTYQKTYYPYKDKRGNPIERPKKEWIVKKIAPEHDMQRANVAHIGPPLKGEFCDIDQGQRVIFRKQQTTFFQMVEGKKYIVTTQDQILGELLQDLKVK